MVRSVGETASSTAISVPDGDQIAICGLWTCEGIGKRRSPSQDALVRIESADAHLVDSGRAVTIPTRIKQLAAVA